MYCCACETTALSEADAVELPDESADVEFRPAVAAALAQSPELVDLVEYRKRDWISLIRLWTCVTPSTGPPRRRSGDRRGR
jgi:hypothetical protein